MPESPILQSAKFYCSPSALFEMYMDSDKHTAATGQRARIGRHAGDSFTAFDGAIRGKNLLVVPNKMIVQAWRSTHWKRSDHDSVLVLQFSEFQGNSRIDLVHINVPHHDRQGVIRGWKKYYWDPWKEYLRAEKRKNPPPKK